MSYQRFVIPDIEDAGAFGQQLLAADSLADAEALLGLPWCNAASGEFGALVAGSDVSPGVRTANRATLQAAMDSGRNVQIPIGVYEIDAALIWDTDEQIISGFNSRLTTIRQRNADEHCIECQSSPEAVGVTRTGILKNIRLVGAGQSTHNTAKAGIYCWQPSAPSMAALRVYDVYVRDFGVGLHLERWDNSYFLNSEFSWNRKNVYAASQTLTCQFISCRNSSALDNCWEVGAAGSITLMSCDTGNSPRHVLSGGTIVIRNCNFETATGGDGVNGAIENTAGRMVIDSCTVLGAGYTLPAVYCGATTYVNHLAASGFTGGGGKVRKASGSILVHFAGPPGFGSNRQAASTMLEHSGQYECVPPGTFDAIRVADIGVAVAGNRGLIQHLMAAAGQRDSLHIGIKEIDESFRWERVLNSDLRTTTLFSGTSGALAVNTWARSTNAGMTTLTLPSAAKIDDEIRVTSIGAAGVTIAQNASQQIRFGGDLTTSGVGGSVVITQGMTVVLKCIQANNGWVIVSATAGTPTLN